MSAAVDFILESPDSNSVLFVEAKNTNSPSAEWAARFALNLLQDIRLGTNHYLLLVLRNKLYLWKHVPAPGAEAADFEASTEDVLRPYLAHLQTSLSEMSPALFELLVKSWLTDLAQGAVPESVGSWIQASGLAAFEKGVVREEVPN